MKKRIKGKVYDAETAAFVGDDQWEMGNFKQTYEALYKKRTGEYFLYGKGGPASKYSESTYDGSGQQSGEKIVPFTYEEAAAWAEDHMDADDYIKAFGDPGEGSDTEPRALYLDIPKVLYDKLNLEKTITGKSLRDLIVELIKEKY